jgi:hypothetical protein
MMLVASLPPDTVDPRGPKAKWKTPTPASGTPGSASTAVLRVMLHTRRSAEAWRRSKRSFRFA